MRLTLISAAVLAGLATPAVAADYAFEVTNSTQFDLVAIHVQGGKVNDFMTVRSNGERQFTLSLPAGVCKTRLNVIFNDSDSVVFDSYDACEKGGIAIGH
ncbi:hypothetical protein [Devosia sp.]|uniref:hypothetical protein n=1 Tax=Devosia sp. TaxID=1871048 RepID=UPI0019E13963|nr:hypothetical protein [Devosia sp.]MBE0580283.1 hypothetical protein [Devosia sp.]